MKKNHRLNYCMVLIFVFLMSKGWTQEFDILIKNGHVIDAKNEISKVIDIAIKDNNIAKIAVNIPLSQAKKIIDAKGMYVSPGLIDIHGHHFFGTEPNAYLSNSDTALPPDGFTFRSGVTTAVDVGGAGWRNFETFKVQTIDRSKTRVLSFLNIVGAGMKGGAVEQNVNDMDPKLTAIVARKYPGIIVGVKLAHFSGFDWTPTERAVEAGKLANIPVMIDFGGSQPELSLKTLFLEKLRPGDIFTHAYAHVKGRTPIVNQKGKVEDFAFEAQKRGIIFDVGHGGGSFLFAQAIPAVQQGFKPNTISTDIHTGSMNGGMKDMLNIMSKFVNLGMSLEEVIAASTWHPAQVIQRTDLGHLSVGAVADIAILNLRKENFGFIDTQGKKMEGDKKLECEVTLREGKVVYDLNGRAAEPWNK
ncbi:amidohydrolase/deacetylase family metallohydrolase [Arenibacter sp. GZD96]|uniref:amidohydrolase/deacetylase family metallohydrolase n=1 Tax=Aurantibrevibacter litoralis TaxID=3106030 RepID=UPI002AFE75D1|nr:amidohydrolase/deacetylase family metallohydrolase [Arenibacter sp. GZD-96]MEA1784807.1 amidohydrolase/deacetylase family metallohydrolase [Arenibacter sp. GZD-96]